MASYRIPQPTILCEIPRSSEVLTINAEDKWDALHSSFREALGKDIEIEIALARTEPEYMANFWDAPFAWWMPIADKRAWNGALESFCQGSTPTWEPCCSMSLTNYCIFAC